jgi:hypothetical protein
MEVAKIAKALGGRKYSGGWTARCPAHDDRNPSLSISDGDDGKTLVHCHAGCDQADVIDALRSRGLWANDDRRSFSRPGPSTIIKKHAVDYDDAKRTGAALAIWAASIPAMGTPVETYLKSRGLAAPPPPTLRFLPATGKYPPAMVAAFAMAQERQPGVLFVPAEAVRAIHLTRLKPDGMGKANHANPKIVLGRGALGIPIIVAPPNDLLGLAVTEGIEDALSVHAATGLGAWAAGGAGRMAALAEAVPDYMDCVTIYGDDDKAGVAGATALLRRLNNRGLFTQIKFFNPGMDASNG